MKPRPGAPLQSAADDDAPEQLQSLLDSLPPPLEPLDSVMVDGYLCGVLLQPRPVPEAHWLAPVIDVDGRAPPPAFDRARLQRLVAARRAELDRAIVQRQWFDPWVYQLDDAASPSETVLPWVAGFASALARFPELTARHAPRLTEPLATLYRNLDMADLDADDALLAEIDRLEPPATLDEAVEDLVRSVLLIADVSRPRADLRPRPGAARRRR